MLDAVTIGTAGSGAALLGAFSFSKANPDLRQAVNAELLRYLGTPEHRAHMAKYGFTGAEIDGVLTDAAPEA